MAETHPNHPYAAFLHKVERPARYVGGEYRSVHKDVAEVRMCLAFPDVYDIGMSHLGTKILYRLINQEADLALERVYAPWFDMERELRAHGLPLVSLESALPLVEFDVVGFSLQYEMTYTNLLNMLDLGGIPLRSEERGLRHPVVIAGGPCATHPEILAPFIDAFLVGDAEEALPQLLRAVGKLRKQGATRLATLRALAQLPGIYVPGLYDTHIEERNDLMVVGRPLFPEVPERVTRAFVADINRYPFPTDSPEPVAEAIFDRVSVEIARGCTEGCRFCQAGMIYRPVRERDPEQVVDTIVAAVESGGYDEASLSSLSTADYSCISPLIKKVMERLRPRNVSLSVSSLRAYGLDEDLLDELASVRATGLTFAPEAGTQRMRDVVNKNISEEDIFTTLHRVFSRAWKRVKLYFMIGLPTETDEDVVGIAEMGRQALEIGRKYQRSIDVTVSVSSHVPKPHTPFQWAAMDGPQEIERKQRILIDLSRRYRFQLRKHDWRISHLEGIVARGDRRGADLLELAWRKGARFDGWDEHLNWDIWQEALTEWEALHGVTREQYLRTLPLDGKLPWDHIDVGLEEKFLAREYKKSLVGRFSPPCGKPVKTQVHHTNLEDAEADQRKLVCYHCGVACDMTQMRVERIDYLSKLGAITRPERNPEVSTVRDQARQRYEKGLTPHTLEQGDKAGYRIRFTKLGQVALQGHLDVVRMLPRMFRRAGLALCYSEGFHPKPVMVFGPALALGIPSIAEYADVRLQQALSEGELLTRLNEVAPEGLRIVMVRRLGALEPKLSKVVSAQELLIRIDPVVWVPTGDDTLAGRCETLLAQASIPTTRHKEGRDKNFDLRPFVLEAAVWPRDAWPGGAGAGAPADALGVRMRLRIDATGPQPQPVEVARALLGAEVPHAAMLRTALWADTDGVLTDPMAVPITPVPLVATPGLVLSEVMEGA